jgi:hypothetical protein
MRKQMTALAAVLFAFTAVRPAMAQVNTIGAKFGATWTDFADDIDDVETSNRTGFMGGAFLSVPLSPRFAIQPEVLYVGKGASASIQDVDLGEFRLGYIEIPLLARLDVTGPQSPLAVYALAGPYVAFQTACTISSTEDEVEAEFECGDEEAEVPDFNSTDFGAALGAGLGFNVGLGTLFVEGRYDIGLTKTVDDPDQSFEDIDLQNRTWALLGGLSIPLGP